MAVLLVAAACVGFGVMVLIHTQHLVTVPGVAGTLRHDHQQAPVLREAEPTTHAAAIVSDLPHQSAANCTTRWIEQRIDHFSWLPASAANATASASEPAIYSQRYLINDQFWDAANPKAPVFFYTGNEGDVTLYANHTGLMWENAAEFNALIVFAEHRYYGQSMPFGDDYMQHLNYLTHEQALADYTELIYFLQQEHNTADHPVIVFGGSYGGMLSAWFRMKHPALIQGAIAASAPIFGFVGYPFFKGDSYWKVVTDDASPKHGSAANCAPNVRKSWPVIFELAKTDAGRAKLGDIFRLCEPLTQESQGEALAMALLVAFDTMAMGNFPYPSAYLTSGNGEMPAWPVRAACSHLADEFADDDKLLAALRDAASVYTNVTQDLQCYKLPEAKDFDGIWDYQWCTEMLPQETYFDRNGVTDMFWARNVTLDEIKAGCARNWQTTPDPTWIRVSYGDEKLRSASNIVFSNGDLDPWSAAGVLHAPKGAKYHVLPIADGAHHLDLFFSHADDPQSVRDARKFEVGQIRAWIDDFVASE
ncbi:TPA: hypothetical protein N0F65_007253 [Lagenidium giganteum]|uniref:Lysosomal Pro-X carboxypeptidase n=1 Tax=Lagenidium giganteum TaxID=4803 RepID=A0AAV2YSC5_9STRA|nr:TPA: hypothetical protein N0F65_007253 [Lagenidium giganteum]